LWLHWAINEMIRSPHHDIVFQGRGMATDGGAASLFVHFARFRDVHGPDRSGSM